jgi:hypothetical protein
MAGCATQAPIGNNGVLSAKAIHVKGSARYKTNTMDWQQLRTSDLVGPGTLIETGAKSRVDLVYEAGFGHNVVRIWGNSLLGVNKLTAKQTEDGLVTETVLDLREGHIRGTVGKLSGASKYEVIIPQGVAGVRGPNTTYDIKADGSIKVLSGAVVQAYLDHADPTRAVTTQIITPPITGPEKFSAPKRRF